MGSNAYMIQIKTGSNLSAATRASRGNEMFINFFRDSGMYVLNRFCYRGISIEDKGNCYAFGNECYYVDFFYIQIVKSYSWVHR